MTEPVVVGARPWLPGSLGRSAWWAAPVPAERLAALRVGTGAVLLLDILLTYWPHASTFFGAGSLGAPEVFGRDRPPFWMWSPLAHLESTAAWQAILVLWALAAIGLMLGVWPRLCAASAWGLALSIANVNPYLINGGDNARTILLFYLMLTPCGAAWSVLHPRAAPVAVYPWALRLLFQQLILIYFLNGWYKLHGAAWRDGSALQIVMERLDWSRAPSLATWFPSWMWQGLAWLTLVWELGFPLWMLHRRTRVPALILGVCFHVGSGVMLRLGPFPLYMLCLYLPLVPWERWRR